MSIHLSIYFLKVYQPAFNITMFFSHINSYLSIFYLSIYLSVIINIYLCFVYLTFYISTKSWSACFEILAFFFHRLTIIYLSFVYQSIQIVVSISTKSISNKQLSVYLCMSIYLFSISNYLSVYQPIKIYQPFPSKRNHL